MCGIIGYKGQKNANEVVLQGLKDLEYRGYDSWGIACKAEELKITKKTGKVGAAKLSELSLPESNTAIAHTRWATHGGVTKENAHPHFSADARFALVQNGIVENYTELRDELMQKQHLFHTPTDTEVIMRLYENELKNNQSTKDALRAVFKKIKGRNAVVIIDQEQDAIYAARNGSPLMIGVGENEYIVASDPAPLLRHTKQIIFLEDNEGLTITDQQLTIFDLTTGQEKQKQPETIEWEIEQAKKGDYPHFMLKEIIEQRESIKQALVQDPELIQKIADEINNAHGIYAVGCGTAGKVCLSGTYSFSTIAKKHINFAFGSEFPNYHHFITDKTLLIVVSQSGETADTLEAIEVVKQKGGKVISLVNVMGSTIMRKSDYSLLLNVGPEIAVASTKATTAQMALMILLAYASAGKTDEGIRVLEDAAQAVESMLTDQFLDGLHSIAQKLKQQDDMYIIGRGINYPTALESAIKIQEVSYIHAEGFAGGELKHGPIALIEKGTPCIALLAADENHNDTISNAIEVKARGGLIVGVGPHDHEAFDVHIRVPEVDPIVSGIVNLIPIHLLSYYLGVGRGVNPDMPRNLAKAVTVK